jgi:zinc/manganese transport system ATP-binding protein
VERPRSSGAADDAVFLEGASLTIGGRTLWAGLDLRVRAGETVAVLGPNGAGKSTLLSVLLGLRPLTSGRVLIEGRSPSRANRSVGWVPQQKMFDADLALRGRDLVRLGFDGNRFPWRRTLKGEAAAAVDRAIEEVGASSFADRSIGRLSGGEQQRLRIAQALLGDPAVLLCDEPLLSLDLAHQRVVVDLIEAHRRRRNAAVMVVTHDINPLLPYADSVLYLVGGRWAAGRPAEVLTSQRLSDLYGTAIDVIEARGRLIVVGADDDHHHHAEAGA